MVAVERTRSGDGDGRLRGVAGNNDLPAFSPFRGSSGIRGSKGNSGLSGGVGVFGSST